MRLIDLGFLICMSRSTRIMIPLRVLRIGFVLLVIFCRQTCADEPLRVSNSICHPKSIKDSILGFHDSICSLNGIDYSFGALGVIEGDETSLLKALSMVNRNTHDYVVVLFYASWCPFSATFRPSLSVMPSLYPSIPHFAIEESVIRRRILSIYGVNGFPTLFILNSTVRIYYHGSRTLDSLVTYYNVVTGIKPESIDNTSLERMTDTHEKGNSSDPETCPFSWARSPENMLRQDTYLALATLFVVSRFLYLSYPFIVKCSQFGWKRHFVNVRVRSLWDYPLNRAIQLFSSLTGCVGMHIFGFGFFRGSKQ